MISAKGKYDIVSALSGIVDESWNYTSTRQTMPDSSEVPSVKGANSEQSSGTKALSHKSLFAK